MLKMAWGRTAAVLLATGLIAPACVQVEETRNPVSESFSEIGVTASPELKGRSAELSRLQFDDIPVPDGFFLRNHRNETYSFSLGGQRVGRFVYWGFGKEDEILRHFEQQMPRNPYGWSHGERPASESGRRLRYEKAGQRCEIEIEPVDRARNDEFLITVFVEST
ncbi:MAG: hypothetical protein R3F20_11640 [Planctomycetota bacterium]